MMTVPSFHLTHHRIIQKTFEFYLQMIRRSNYQEIEYTDQKINFRNLTDNQPKPDTNLSKLKLCCNFFCCLDSNFSRKIIVFGIYNFETQTIFGSSHSWNSIWKQQKPSPPPPPIKPVSQTIKIPRSNQTEIFAASFILWLVLTL